MRTVQGIPGSDGRSRKGTVCGGRSRRIRDRGKTADHENKTAGKKKEGQMMIEAIITFKDGTVRSLLFDCFEDVGAWYDKRQAHIDTITARMITFEQMRQGRGR